MWFFYAVATIWFLVGALLWARSSHVVFWEWMLAAAAAFITAGIFHWCVIRGMTADVETWSGQVTEARHYTAWTEYYEYAVYRTETRTGTRTCTDSKGRSYTQTYTYTVEVFDHWQPTTRYHPDSWGYSDSLGGGSGITRAVYEDIIARFGAEAATAGSRSTLEHNSHMISGDPNDRISVNRNQFVKPVTAWRSWSNRVKAAPSAFCFRAVPKDAKVFDYPKNDDPFASDRLQGTATSIPLLAWDQMNARLGPTKKVNVIAIGFGTADRELAELQQAKWIGGKKNDLVLCYGGPTPIHATWAKCFGWSDSEVCKRNLETIVLQSPINATIVPKLEAEIAANYQIKDWSQFDYLTIEPPGWSYSVFFIIIAVVQIAIWWVFLTNDLDKAEEQRSAAPRRRAA